MINSDTQKFVLERNNPHETKRILEAVYVALDEKGYNPLTQIIGYILSGDPTYITSHKNARALIGKLERDELLEELVRDYLRGVV
ncbi:MAG: IreB family regulatory phosphoprotein [Defluviitaleaceae bacterium]|nr:IreB family regulatory phosphoprotein [Defluviitaleaceae bacterium]MCL2239193.1 IreB family regulatory phosphoprotein [Defluviitaleaceae bacterium]